MKTLKIGVLFFVVTMVACVAPQTKTPEIEALVSVEVEAPAEVETAQIPEKYKNLLIPVRGENYVPPPNPDLTARYGKPTRLTDWVVHTVMDGFEDRVSSYEWEQKYTTGSLESMKCTRETGFHIRLDSSNNFTWGDKNYDFKVDDGPVRKMPFVSNYIYEYGYSRTKDEKLFGTMIDELINGDTMVIGLRQYPTLLMRVKMNDQKRESLKEFRDLCNKEFGYSF